ncbi:hypothetical protein [Pseudomonas poae]|uniref:hypothetical protein n=1 Tax=Pseudomonas poae TaxID=200451 RepID=UPI0011B0C725|nr:hypothetical protein [Pseudomonas poae]
MIRLLIPWLMLPYVIDWLDGDFAKSALLIVVFIGGVCFKNLVRGFVVENIVVVTLVGMAVLSLYWPQYSGVETTKILLYGLLSVAGWVGVLLGRPFTLQYSVSEVTSICDRSGSFFVINNTISIVWCVSFSINLILAFLNISFEFYWPLFLLGSYMSILIASVITEVFPDAYLKKCEARS